jgi:hypothetical protein
MFNKVIHNGVELISRAVSQRPPTPNTLTDGLLTFLWGKTLPWSMGMPSQTASPAMDRSEIAQLAERRYQK